MAHSNDLGVASLQFRNGGAITANSMVTLDTTAGRVVACTAITDTPVGVCMDTGSSTAGNEQVRVQIFGVAKCRIGDTVTVGQELMVKGSGTGELVLAAGATANTCAKALEAGASGDIVAVLLLGPVGQGRANS
jgi:hypothetical protein